MNGAQALIQTLVDAGVEVCFTNPGTSEMHFVAALDDVPGMRAVLGLFEGVVTGAADGYGRMADKPAATLLHLGPGLGNGLANLHNARRAHTPVLNIVGDHATYHKQYDAPLESDIDAIAGAVSGWVHRSMTPDAVAHDAATAVAGSMSTPGQVATLILPADVCWLEAPGPAAPVAPAAPAPVDAAALADAVAALQGDGKVMILLGGRALRDPGLTAAHQISDATGAGVLAETFPARLERGAGVPTIDRLAYLAEFAQMQLDGVDHIILIGAAAPVSFFAYPGKASVLTPENCVIHDLCGAGVEPTAVLDALVAALGARGEVTVPPASRPERPTGPLTTETMAQAVGALLPERAIVVDESNTSGLYLTGATAGCPRHDWLTLTGGAIGIALPLATGAAIAAPDRPVLCVESDGSAMYTISALWTQVREQLNIVTIICNNSSYAVLNMELARVGAEQVGPKALSMLDLHDPDLDFVAISTGMGVPATRATTAEEFTEQLAAAFATPGPVLIEAMIPPLAL